MRSKELTWHYGDVITTLQQEIPYQEAYYIIHNGFRISTM